MILSVFPSLFTYAITAPFLLRIALGGFFILQGIRRHKEDGSAWNTIWADRKIGSVPIASTLAKIETIIGVLLVIGLFTQVASILAIVFVWVEWFKKRGDGTATSFQELWMTVFVSTISLALLFLGAGLIAFDLPL